MLTVAFDTETHTAKPGLAAPPMVCLTYANTNGEKGIYKPDDAKNVFAKWLVEAAKKTLRLVGHNVAYDMVVCGNKWPDLIPAIFKAYDAGMVIDTGLQHKLNELCIETTKISKKTKKKYITNKMKDHYSLADLASELLDITLDKSSDTWRLHYELLESLPLEYWPANALNYAINDARVTLAVYRTQKEHVDAAAQARSAFGLKLMSTWGITIDLDEIERVKRKQEDIKDKCKDGYTDDAGNEIQGLVNHGLMRKNGSVDTKLLKELVVKHYPGLPPRTDKGNVSTDVKVLAECNMPILKTLVKYKRAHKVISSYTKNLMKYSNDGVSPIHCYVNELLQTGRISMSSPALQQIPRDAGVRECFVPRKGMVFCSADYDSAELRAYGQVLKNYDIESTLTRVFDDPAFDPHLYFAAVMLRIEYSTAVKDKDEGYVKNARMGAKGMNFTVPGGGGAATIKAANSELLKEWSLEEVEDMKKLWRETYNVEPYTTMMNGVVNGKWVDGKKEPPERAVTSFVSGRIRAGLGFCQACNNPFQSLVGDGSKLAIYNITKAMYAEPESPLYGSRIVLYVHDEIMMETPIEGANEAAKEMSRIMIESMEVYTPDVPAGATPVLMDRWIKGADPIYNEEGELLVCSKG